MISFSRVELSTPITVELVNREQILPLFSQGDLIVFKGGTKNDGAKFRYEHWAVYVGEGEIVHYQAPRELNGLTAKLNSGVIQETLQEYMERQGEGMTVRLGKLSSEGDRRYFPALDPEVVVERARSKVGKKEYNLIRNNCEHFAKWCKYGKEMSDQIERGAVIASMLGGFLAGGYAGIMNGMTFAGLLGAMIGGCAGAVGGGLAIAVIVLVSIKAGRKDELLTLGRLVVAGDICILLNLYTSGMIACIWKGFLIVVIDRVVLYQYGKYSHARPWVKKTGYVALAVLLIFAAGYASTNAVGEIIFGVAGVFAGTMGNTLISYVIGKGWKMICIAFPIFLITITISVLLTGTVTVAWFCLAAYAGGICVCVLESLCRFFSF